MKLKLSYPRRWHYLAAARAFESENVVSGDWSMDV